MKHEGQDRTPYCSTCSTRGHYRDACPALDVNEEELTLQIPPDHIVQDSWAKAVEKEERRRNQAYRRFGSEEETERINKLLEENQQDTERQDEMESQEKELQKSDIEHSGEESEASEASEVESNVTSEDLETLTQRLEDLEKTLGRDGFEKKMDDKLKKLKRKQAKKRKRLLKKKEKKKGD